MYASTAVYVETPLGTMHGSQHLLPYLKVQLILVSWAIG